MVPLPKQDDEKVSPTSGPLPHRESSESGESSSVVDAATPKSDPSDENDSVEQPPLPTDELPPPLPAENPPQLPDELPPPLPDETVPPIPNEKAPPVNDDGWEPMWDAAAQAFYFFNHITQKSQWENPRVPESATAAPPLPAEVPPPSRQSAAGSAAGGGGGGGGYNPAIHGDFDPNADYAQAYIDEDEETRRLNAAAAAAAGGASGIPDYAATGAFNRFTGKWQNADINPENYSDESKSKRQMSAFFDIDAAAQSHDGRSLKAERQKHAARLTRKEVKAFQEKRREKKEEKRRAWLRD